MGEAKDLPPEFNGGIQRRKGIRKKRGCIKFNTADFSKGEILRVSDRFPFLIGLRGEKKMMKNTSAFS